MRSGKIKNGEEGANKTDSFVKREVCSQHVTQIQKYAVDLSFGLLTHASCQSNHYIHFTCSEGKEIAHNKNYSHNLFLGEINLGAGNSY